MNESQFWRMGILQGPCMDLMAIIEDYNNNNNKVDIKVLIFNMNKKYNYF